MAEHPDGQDIVQWLGAALDYGSGTSIPGAGGITKGPFIVSTWQGIIVLIKPTGGTVTITLKNTHGSVAASLEVDQVKSANAGAVSALPFALYGDTISVNFTGGGGVTADWAIVPSNTAQLAATIGAVSGTRVSALPSSPSDGQEVWYIADATNNVEWHLEYVASAAKWRFLGGPPLFSFIATNENTASAVYTDLATVGPSVTAPLAGGYLVQHGATLLSNNAGTVMWQSIKLGSTGAVDADGVSISASLSTDSGSVAIMVGQKVLAAADVVKAQYKSPSAVTGYASNRWLALTPVYVTG